MTAYKPGALVRYGQAGVCEVGEVVTMNTGAGDARYYALTPLYKAGSSKVFVPCDNGELTERMRPLLTKEEIASLRKRAKETACPWNRDFRKRSEESRRALGSPDRLDALLLIKSILAHKKEMAKIGKNMHTTDDYFLRDAEILVFSEIAHVTGKPYEAVEADWKKLLSED